MDINEQSVVKAAMIEKIKKTKGSVGTVLDEQDHAYLLLAALNDQLAHPKAKFADVCAKAFRIIEDCVIKFGLVQRTLAPTRCSLDTKLLDFAQNLLPEEKEESENAKSK